mgnify:CR=1 FL=1
MKKRILAIVLSMVVALDVCGCATADLDDAGSNSSAENTCNVDDSGNGNASDENVESDSDGDVDNDADNDTEISVEPVKKTSKMIQYADGEISSISEYEYDKRGRVIKEILTFDGESTERTITWEDNGNTAVGTDNYGHREVCEYDEYGNLLSSKTYITDEHVIRDVQYTYVDGVLAEKIDINSTLASMALKTITTYDSYGSFIGQLTYYNDELKGDIVNKYQYDEDGNVLTQTMIDNLSNDSGVTEVEYDENGHMTGTKSYHGEELISHTDYVCDENGNILESKNYYGDKLVIEYIYTYY